MEVNSEVTNASVDDTLVVDLLVPGRAEPYKLTLSDTDSVMELKQIVIQSMEPSLRTCFSLTLDGKTPLDDNATVSSNSKIKDGAVLRVLDEPYNLREVIFHFTRLRETLSIGDKMTSTAMEGGLPISLVTKLTSERTESLIVEELEEILDSSKTLKLTDLVYGCDSNEGTITCLTQMEISPFNPPLSHRKLLGDLLYLDVLTLEGKQIFITCSQTGFYVNKSTATNFDPTPLPDSHRAYTLSTLLSSVSYGFKTNLNALLKRIEKQELLEISSDQRLINNWLSKPQPVSKNSFKGYEAVFNVVGIDDIINGQIRDWNEELQTVKGFEVSTSQKRILRERSLYRIFMDKSFAARRGAIAILEGSVRAINQSDPFKTKLFFWNNLFYSITCDVKEVFKHIGGDGATHSATALDMKGVEILCALSPPDVAFIGCTLIDYCGYRIVAQTIVPGIFHKDQNDIIEHGIMMDNTNLKHDERFNNITSALADFTHSRPARLIDINGEEKTFNVSAEIKGVVGTDGRFYLIDLYRLFTPDPLFVDEERKLNSFLPKDFVYAYEAATKHCGYQFSAKRFKNKMRMFRSRLIEFYVDYCYHKFTHEVSVEFEKKRKADGITDEVSLRELLLKLKEEFAVKFLSASKDSFILSSNADCFNDKTLVFAESEKEKIEKDRAICHNISSYFVDLHIPTVVKKMNEEFIIDGESLSDFLHLMGINMRYLGYIHGLAAKDKMVHIEKICVSEMIIRTTKKILRKYLSETKVNKTMIYLVSHFLNCLLGSHEPPKTYNFNDALMTKKRKKKNSENSFNWSSMGINSLWEHICNDIMDFYNFELGCTSMADVWKKFGITPTSLLRRICKVVGLQILLKNYDFNSNKHCSFCIEDIMNILPVMKTINLNTRYIEEAMIYAKEIMTRRPYDALMSLRVAQTYVTQIYGLNNPLIGEFFHLVARCCYYIDQMSEAIQNQKRAALTFERYYGLDHYKTIQSYLYLGLFYYYNKEFNSSLQLITRAIYLVKLCYGHDHPELTNYYVNQAIILSSMDKNDLALKLLDEALRIAKINNLEDRVAFTQFILAKQQVCSGQYRSALNSGKEACKIYEKLYGNTNSRAVNVREFLKNVTQMAVAKEQQNDRRGKQISFASRFDVKPSEQDFSEAFSHLSLGNLDTIKHANPVEVSNVPLD